jgi:HD-GYP domain-containing protein (c-di-GMP phosphodiesterase class II)
LEHAVVASLVATGLAHRLNLGDDKLQTVAMAGLFHDVGKLYIPLRQDSCPTCLM